MTVRITDPDALDKMAQIEGDGWKRQQDQDRKSAYGFWAFHDLWVRLASGEHEDEDWYRPDDNLTVEGNPATYGDGGWNRYFVRRSDGRIVISKYHATERSLELAELAGFDIWR